MNRRRFLGLFASAAAVTLITPPDVTALFPAFARSAREYLREFVVRSARGPHGLIHVSAALFDAYDDELLANQRIVPYGSGLTLLYFKSHRLQRTAWPGWRAEWALD